MNSQETSPRVSTSVRQLCTRKISVHARELMGRHRRMRTERGQHGFEMLAVVLPRKASEIAGTGMDARLIGRNSQDAVPRAQLVERLIEQRLQLLVGEVE